jgi:hypothetical protein
MFGHYRAILRELVINALPSYTSIFNAAVGNTIYNYKQTPISTDSVSMVSVIRGLLRPKKKFGKLRK